MHEERPISRRQILKGLGAGLAVAAVAFLRMYFWAHGTPTIQVLLVLRA
jgi:hypothetical protein